MKRSYSFSELEILDGLFLDYKKALLSSIKSSIVDLAIQTHMIPLRVRLQLFSDLILIFEL